MSGFHFANPAAFVLCIAAPLLAIAWLYGDRRRSAALAAWGRGPAAAPRRPWKRVLQAAACVAIVLSLARPAMPVAASRVPIKATGDIVFLLDVSRSMLSGEGGDLRLYRAREWIRQLGARAGGQRVALMAFAGTQAVQCPLTLDHAFFDEMVKETGPDSVPLGGTKIGDAVRFAAGYVFDDVERDAKTIVVVSDGGDQESAPAAAAREAAKRGIRVIAIGVGDPGRELPVPESLTDRRPIVYQGRTVSTRLEEASLRALGQYAPGGGTGAIDAEAVFRRYLVPVRRAGKERSDAGDTLWMACLAVAILLLAIDARVPERRVVQAALLAVAVLAAPLPGMAQSIEEWFNKGVAALEAKRYEDAVRYFSEASMWSPGTPEVRFNLGKTLYEFKSYAESAGSFEMAAAAARDPQLKAKCKLGQGNAMFRAAEQFPREEIKRYQAALEAYKQAQALDPSLFDAEFNRNVVERRLQQARDRQNLSNWNPNAQPPSPAEVDADAEKLLQEMAARGPTSVPRPAERRVERDW